MAGCRSCSGHSHKTEQKRVRQREKLGNCELSSNLGILASSSEIRHVLGRGYATDRHGALGTNSDECCDYFTLKPLRILKDVLERNTPQTTRSTSLSLRASINGNCTR